MIKVSVKSAVEAGIRRLSDALAARLKPDQVATAVGEEAAQHTRDHFFGLASTRHRKHVALNFWEDAAGSVGYRPDTEGVVITVDKPGVAQRYFGGTITHRNYSHLWIPTDENAGKAPGEFEKMFKLINPTTNRGVALLKGRVMFYLVPEVTQDEDKSVLPTDSEYETAAGRGVDNVVDLILEKTQ